MSISENSLKQQKGLNFKKANEVFNELMQRLESDVNFIESKYGKESRAYIKQMDYYNALSEIQMITVDYIRELEREIFHDRCKMKIMSAGYRQVTDMKIKEITELTDEQIKEIATLQITQ